MEIEQSFRRETNWKIKFSATKLLIFSAIEDSEKGIDPEVTIIARDDSTGSEIRFKVSKDRFLNLSGIIDSFGQVVLGVSPSLPEEEYLRKPSVVSATDNAQGNDSATHPSPPKVPPVHPASVSTSKPVSEAGSPMMTDSKLGGASPAASSDPLTSMQQSSVEPLKSGNIPPTSISGSEQAESGTSSHLGPETLKKVVVPAPKEKFALEKTSPPMELKSVPDATSEHEMASLSASSSTTIKSTQIEENAEKSWPIPQIAYPPRFPDEIEPETSNESGHEPVQEDKGAAAEEKDEKDEDEDEIDDSALEWDPW
ncbi:MAG: hypothetical protein ACTSWN_02920 [Promethearchaeota archaeon]